MKKEKQSARLLTTEKTKRENSAVLQQIRHDVSTNIMKVASEKGALVTLQGRAVKEVKEWKKRREAATRKLDDFCEGEERVEYKRTDCRRG